MAKKHFATDETFQDFLEETIRHNKAIEEANGVGVTEYGIGWVVGQSSPTGIRFMRKNGVLYQGDNVTLSYTAGVGSTECVNDFESVTDFDNFNPTTVNLAAGKFKRFYQSYYGLQTIGVYNVLWVCSKKLYDWYKLPQCFNRTVDGVTTEGYWKYVDIGCYKAGEEYENSTNYLVSKPDLFPLHDRTRTQEQTYATNWHAKLGTDTDDEYYSVTTLSMRTELLNPIIMVMTGTKNIQAYYYGECYNYTYYYPILSYTTDSDAGTTTFYLGRGDGGTGTTTTNVYFRTGGSIVLCTTLNSINRQNYSVSEHTDDTYAQCLNCSTTSGATDSDGNTYYSTVTIDKVIDGTEGYTYLSTVPFKTGATDYNESNAWQSVACLKGNDGTYENNGYYPYKILGIENLHGNIWETILDVTIVNYVPYICKDISNWTDSSSPASNSYFEACNYSVSETTSSYVKALGTDDEHPDVRLPIEVGASATTYFADYYWIASGTRTTYFGGSLHNGLNVGLWCASLSNAVGYSYWGCGCRLSHFSRL